MISSTYNEDDNIIFIERIDEINKGDVLKLIKNLDSQFSSFNTLYIIDDFSKSISNFVIQDYPDMVNEIQKKIKNYHEVRYAVITNTPRNTALSLMYEEISKDIKGFHYKTFSNIEPAKEWLFENV